MAFKMYKRFIVFIRRLIWSVKGPAMLNQGHFMSGRKGSVLSREHVNYRGGKVNAVS